MKKHVELTFVKRYFGIFSETRSIELPVSSVDEAQEDALKSDGCFGYIVNQREYVKVDGKRFYAAESQRVKNVVFGQVFTREQVNQMEFLGKLDVLRKMDENGVDKAVKLCTGRWLSPDDFGKEVIFVDR